MSMKTNGFVCRATKLLVAGALGVALLLAQGPTCALASVGSQQRETPLAVVGAQAAAHDTTVAHESNPSDETGEAQQRLTPSPATAYDRIIWVVAAFMVVVIMGVILLQIKW